MKLRLGLATGLTFAGSALVGLGCALPYAVVCDVFCKENQRPSLVDDANHQVSWFVAEPLLAIVFALVAVLLMLAARGPAGKAAAAGMLTIAGALTFAFFVGLLGSASLQIGVGALMGAAGGFLLTIGGVVAAFTFPSRKADSALTAR
jgi:predicted small integral membrane protein